MSSESIYEVGSLASVPEVAMLLGEFIARWSLAETTLLFPLLVTLNSSNQEVGAAILASTNSTEGKIKLVRSSVENMPQQDARQAAMKSSLKEFEALCVERNAICHHLWAFRQGDEHATTIDYRRPANPGRFTSRSASSLRELCNKTADIAFAICILAGSSWITEETVKRFRL